MLRGVIKTDSYFVIYLGDNQYARWVNDCAWHMSDLAGATKISKDEVNKNVKEIIKAGYAYAEPKAVDSILNVYDVPKKDKDVVVPVFDVGMYDHPYHLYPRMAKMIIDIKTDYSDAKACGNAEFERAVLSRMRCLVNEYKELGVHFCPNCNKIDGGTFLTPITFGRVLTWSITPNSYEGYECSKCGYQSMRKIEHWS